MKKHLSTFLQWVCILGLLYKLVYEEELSERQLKGVLISLIITIPTLLEILNIKLIRIKKE